MAEAMTTHTTLPTPETPESPALNAAAEQATLDRMALAAHAVLAHAEEPPIRVLLGVADDRQAQAGRSGTRYAPADPGRGQPLPTVMVTVGRQRKGTPEVVAAAVAIGLANLRHGGCQPDAVTKRRGALFGMGLAKRPSADTVDAVLLHRGVAQTTAFARAVRAAGEALGADPLPTGGAALAAFPTGKRWVLEWEDVAYDAANGERKVTLKTLELRPADRAKEGKGRIGDPLTLVLLDEKGARVATLATGILRHQKKGPGGKWAATDPKGE